MKEYKLINSEEVIEKALKLGYHFARWSRSVMVAGVKRREGCVFVYLLSDGSICFGSSLDTFNKLSSEEITRSDFLNLREPIKVDSKVLIETIGFNDDSYSIVGIVSDIIETILFIRGVEHGFDMCTHKITEIKFDRNKY